MQRIKNKSLFILALFSFTCALPFISAAYAAEVTLAWDRPDDDRISGYAIFYGEAGTDFLSAPRHIIDSPDVTRFAVHHLNEGQVIGFSVKSTDAGGNESDFSDILYYYVPSGDDMDDDGDGFTENQGDHDDTNDTIYPGAPEIVGDGIDQDCDGSDLLYTPAPEGVVMENGEIQIDHQWIFVPLTEHFKHPIVVAKSMSLNGTDPAVIRIRHVDIDGFEIRIQEWNYLDGTHNLETVNYVVLEAGSHTLPDGTMVEAGTFEKNSGIGPVAFSKPFNEVPVLLTSVVTLNEADAVTGRMRHVDRSGFEFHLQEEEGADRAHIKETISYIAWEPSSGEIGGMTYEVARTPNSITHYFSYINFTAPFVGSPVFISDMQTRNGGDTAGIRWHNKDVYGVELRIEEEQSLDSETNHTTERVGYLAIQNETS